MNNLKKTSAFAGTNKRGRGLKKGTIELEPVIGTRDFYPEDMRIRTWLFNEWRNTAKSFCFSEYDAPLLELEELYKRKAGEDITKQMYNFKDKESYEVSLRPEMTPSLARMILKKDKSLLLPLKWFSISQCWRFETVSLGRMREHYQWNMDIVGEVELLAAITTFFSNIGLTSQDIGIKVNSRKVLQSILEPLISLDKFAPVCVIVDKLDKLSLEEVNQQLLDLGLDLEVITKIINSLKIENLVELEELLGADNAGVIELKEFWVLAQAYGFENWLIFDPSVVRGLSYYTGIVFEAFDRNKEFRAICGGGRYDELFSLYGAKKPIPAVGFGMGDVVIIELLKSKNLLPIFVSSVDVVVIAYNEELRSAACQVASKLRNSGKRVDVQLITKKNIGSSYDYADRVSAELVCLVAPDEWSRGEVRFKNMRLSKDDPNKQYNMLFNEI
jgi:histidyl-tRNA synthetase